MALATIILRDGPNGLIVTADCEPPAPRNVFDGIPTQAQSALALMLAALEAATGGAGDKPNIILPNG